MLTWRDRLNGLPRESRDTLFLLLVIGWIMLPQVARLPVWATMLAVAFLVWRGWLAWESKPLPNKWWVLGLLAVTVVATLATHRTVLGRDAGVTMIFMLLALKTLELRARRDIFVVFFLGFFTMLTNFFFSQSLLTAGAMVVALLGLLTALVNAHMPVGKPPLAEAARTAGWMALLGAPVMATLFVLFPRFGPLWGMPSDAMSGRSGLSSTMQVGNLASLALDDSVAMRVRFAGRVPEPDEMYFRGPVLSAFDGREWRPMQQRFRVRSGAPAPAAQLQVTGEAVRYEVTLEPNNRPWILVLDAASEPPEVPGFETVMNGELVWFANKPVTDLLRYTAESHTQFRYGPRSLGGVPFEYLDLPPGTDPRTRELALQLKSDPRVAAAGPSALVRAALERLRTGGYTYTLEPGTYGDNTADEFWFDRKQGFCEHIASAFVVLMRAGGVPARIVTGYQGGERNPVDGYWIVRQSDAHAWAEVWLAGQGWVRVDPTAAVSPGRVGTLRRLQPPQGVFAAAIGAAAPGLAASVRAFWDAMNNGWNQWVLNYTQSKQINMLKDIGFRAPGWEDLATVLIVLLVLVALAGAAWSLWDRREHDPWLRLLQGVRARLAKSGMELPASAPPRRMAAMVRERFGERASALADWLLELEAQRYGPAPSMNFNALKRSFKKIPWPA